jgi:hypothetical protein
MEMILPFSRGEEHCENVEDEILIRRVLDANMTECDDRVDMFVNEDDIREKRAIAFDFSIKIE